MQMLGVQQQVMAAQLPIVSPEHIYKSIAGLVRDANLGSPADYVTDPETLKDPQTGQMPPQPPSAEEQKAQAELQMQAAKLQGEQQMQAQKLDAMREEAMLKAQLARQVAETEAQLARDKAEFEAQQARDKFEFEKVLAVEKLQFEERRSQADAARRDKETDAKVSANRPGGKLDE
jgi:multidrug efflux pump subunit AcrA (membrane-fusion protein)